MYIVDTPNLLKNVPKLLKPTFRSALYKPRFCKRVTLGQFVEDFTQNTAYQCYSTLPKVGSV